MDIEEYKRLIATKSRKRYRHLEDDLQMQCVRWFEIKWPKMVMFAIPNGGKRNPREAARLKRMGVRAGVSDLFLSEPVCPYHGLYLELKVEDNDTTKNQKMFLNNARERGYAVDVCKTLDQFITTITAYLQGKFINKGDADA